MDFINNFITYILSFFIPAIKKDLEIQKILESNIESNNHILDYNELIYYDQFNFINLVKYYF
jgi:hypothetical protein